MTDNTAPVNTANNQVANNAPAANNVTPTGWPSDTPGTVAQTGLKANGPETKIVADAPPVQHEAHDPVSLGLPPIPATAPPKAPPPGEPREQEREAVSANDVPANTVGPVVLTANNNDNVISNTWSNTPSMIVVPSSNSSNVDAPILVVSNTQAN